MNNIWKIAALPAVAFSLMATPALAAEPYDGWDSNSDSQLDMNEYRTGLDKAGVFDKWDADKNGTLSETEFNENIGDNTTAFNERFGENAYADWDADDNNELSEDEFYENSYAAYDADSDKVIEEPELGDLGDDMGDGGFWDV